MQSHRMYVTLSHMANLFPSLNGRLIFLMPLRNQILKGQHTQNFDFNFTHFKLDSDVDGGSVAIP